MDKIHASYEYLGSEQHIQDVYNRMQEQSHADIIPPWEE